MINPIDDFKATMRVHGLTPPDIIEPEKFHRFLGVGKTKGNKAGYCKLFSDGVGGVFGDYSSGLSETWQLEHKSQFTQPHPQTLEKQRQARERAAREKHLAAAREAEYIIQTSREPDLHHDYLKRKQVLPYNLRQHGKELVVPIRDPYANLTTLQFINEGGGKRYLAGGKKQGCFASIGEVSDVIYLCEGWATGASIHQATGKGVIVGLDCNNLIEPPKKLSDKFISSTMFVCGDSDTNGSDKALIAAKLLNKRGEPILPKFKNSSKELTDFNDLMVSEGIDEVRSQIEFHTHELLKKI